VEFAARNRNHVGGGGAALHRGGTLPPGRSFSIKAEAHRLVTTGLYSKIRNPIYVFGMVMITGMILVLQRPEGWLVLVAAIVGQTIRARREAQVLEAAFGDEYREYRRKTWF
jgi:protein-S-isoprenylcysteine O-methyltransferase Ste14